MRIQNLPLPILTVTSHMPLAFVLFTLGGVYTLGVGSPHHNVLSITRLWLAVEEDLNSRGLVVDRVYLLFFLLFSIHIKAPRQKQETHKEQVTSKVIKQIGFMATSSRDTGIGYVPYPPSNIASQWSMSSLPSLSLLGDSIRCIPWHICR